MAVSVIRVVQKHRRTTGGTEMRDHNCANNNSRNANTRNTQNTINNACASSNIGCCYTTGSNEYYGLGR